MKKGKTKSDRLEALIESISNTAALDFSKKVEIVGDDSLEDVIAKGLNMLAEEWEDSVVSREELKISESQLKKAQEAAKLGHWELDLVSGKLFWSEEIYRIFDIEPGNLGASYETFLQSVHPDDMEMVKEAYATSVKEKKRYEIDHQLLLKSGEVKWVNERGETFYAEDGTPLKSVGTVQDITERWYAERRRLEYVDILDRSINEIYVFDAKTLKFISINKAASKNLGYSLEEAKHLTPLSLKPQYSKRQFLALLEPLKSGEKKNLQFDTKHKRKNGSNYPVSVNLQLSKFEGNPVFLALILDTSEQKKGEMTYQALLETMNDGVLQVDNEDLIQFVNGQFCKIVGYTREELLGQNADLLFSMDGKLSKDNTRRLAERQKGKTERYEMQLKSKSGKVIWVGISAAPIHDENGKVRGSIGVTTDISERIKKEKERERLFQQIRNSEEQHRSLFDSSPLGITLVEPNSGAFVYANEAFLSILGYTLEELRHMIVSDLAPASQRDQAKQQIALLKKTGNVTFESERLHKNGSLVPIEMTLSMTVYGDDLPVMMGNIVDITERKKAETQKEVSHKIAKKANEDIPMDEFLDYVREEVCRLINTDEFYVSRFDHRKAQLDFLYYHGKQWKKTDLTPRKNGKSLSEHVARTGKNLVLSSEEVFPFVKKHKLKMYGKKPGCWLGVPLSGDASVIGALSLQSFSNKNVFTRENVQFISFISDQIGQFMDRKRAEHEIKQSEKKYRGLFEKMNEGLLFSNLDGNINMVNPTFCKIVGYKPDELIGKNGYRLFHDKKEIAGITEKADERRQGRSEQYELQFITKSGSKIWTRVSSSPHYNEKGEFIGVMSIISDINEQKKAELKERALFNIGKKANSQLVSISYLAKAIHKEVGQVIDAKNMYLALHDKETNIISFPYWKDECNSTLGDQLYAQRHFGDGLTEQIVKSRKPIILSGKELKSTHKNRIKVGAQIPQSWLGVPLISDGRVIGILAVHSCTNADAYGVEEREFMRFVSRQIGGMVERIQAQEAVMANQKRLMEANKELETFIYKSSHDLKGPISSTQGLINLVKQEDLDEQLGSYIEMIDGTMDKAEGILDDLTSITMIRQGALLKAAIDFEKITREIVESFRFLPGCENIIFSINNKLKEPFCSDPSLLATILRNLIQNSIRYAAKRRNGSYVNVSILKEKAGLVRIVVADNGVGIPKIHQKKIFDMFHRANETSEGTGLGLYIVKNAVEKLDGKILLESKEGKGSKFEIILPST